MKYRPSPPPPDVLHCPILLAEALRLTPGASCAELADWCELTRGQFEDARAALHRPRCAAIVLDAGPDGCRECAAYLAREGASDAENGSHGEPRSPWRLRPQGLSPRAETAFRWWLRQGLPGRELSVLWALWLGVPARVTWDRPTTIECYETRAELATRTGLSVATVRRALRGLRDRGAVSRRRSIRNHRQWCIVLHDSARPLRSPT